MKTLRYLVSCIIGCFDAFAGKGTDQGLKDSFAGLFSLLVVVGVFLASVFLLGKTKLKYSLNIVCSVCATLLVIALVSLLIVILEDR